LPSNLGHMEMHGATTKAGGTAIKADTQSFDRTLARVLLQEVATGRYYQSPGVWTSDEAHAFDFQTGSAARECAAKLSLVNVQVVKKQEFRERQIFPLPSTIKP